ncbi:MAG: ATP-binding protein [Acidimicrobiales bacterium]
MSSLPAADVPGPTDDPDPAAAPVAVDDPDPAGLAGRLEALAAMTSAMATARDEDELYAVIATHVGDVLPRSHATLLLFEESGGELSIVHLDDGDGTTAGWRVATGAGALGRLDELGALHPVDRGRPDLATLGRLALAGSGSAVVTPLSTAAGPIGGLALSRAPSDAFTVADVAVARHLGELIGVAATATRATLAARHAARAAARAQQVAARRAHEMEVLHRIIAALGAVASPEEAAALVVDELVGLHGVDLAAIAVGDADDLRPVAAAARTRQLTRAGIALPATSPLHHKAMAGRRSILVRNGDAEVGGFRPADAGLTSLLVTPVVVDDQAVGLLSVASTKRNRLVADELVAVVEAVAAQLGRAAERSDLLADARRSAEQADAADRAKTDFLLSATSRLRPPLNTVIGMTTVLATTALDDVQASCVDTIRASADGLLSVVDDMADVGRVEAGGMELALRSFELRSVVEDALDVVAAQAGCRGVDLVYEMDPSLPVRFVGDPARIRQILVNLVANAVRFTHDGSVVVEVEPAEPVPAYGAGGAEGIGVGVGVGGAGGAVGHPRCRVHLAVSDTGCGIDPDGLDALFPPLPSNDDDDARRSTLGLTIANDLAVHLGGRLWAESEEGVGSTFHCVIDLPVASEQTIDPVAGRQPTLVGCRVLVVDGNPAGRDVVTRRLRRWGMEPVAAATSLEALSLADHLDFDVVLTDHRIHDERPPIVDGLRQRRFAGALVVIRPPLVAGGDVNRTTPGAGSDPTVGSVPTVGSDPAVGAVVTKPVKPAELCRVLHRVRGASPGPVTSAEARASLGDRHPLRILVVDGDDERRGATVAVLSQLGYRPEEQADARSGFDAVARYRYDLVVVVSDPPHPTATELGRRIRSEIEPRRQPRLVVMGGDGGDEARQAWLDAGFDRHLGAPLGIEAFTSELAATPRLPGR